MSFGFYTGKAVTIIEFRRWSTPNYIVHRVRVQMRPAAAGKHPHTPFALGRRLRLSREGVDWARGHAGEDVEALITAAALR